MWNFTLHKRVEKFFDKHPELAQVFYDILKEILVDPHAKISADITPLSGVKNCYRLRIGKYRFLYEIQSQEIVVYFYDAGSR